MKLTNRLPLAGLALPPGKGDHIEWDDTLPGFGVRLRGRNKGWVVQYRFGRQQRQRKPGRRAQGQARSCPPDRAPALCTS